MLQVSVMWCERVHFGGVLPHPINDCKQSVAACVPRFCRSVYGILLSRYQANCRPAYRAVSQLCTVGTCVAFTVAFTLWHLEMMIYLLWFCYFCCLAVISYQG